jgi:hypothetical protein
METGQEEGRASDVDDIVQNTQMYNLQLTYVYNSQAERRLRDAVLIS